MNDLAALIDRRYRIAIARAATNEIIRKAGVSLSDADVLTIARIVMQAVDFDAKGKLRVIRGWHAFDVDQHRLPKKAEEDTGYIDLYPDDAKPAEMPGVVAHEIMHQKLQRVRKQVQPEIDAVLASGSIGDITPYAAHYWSDRSVKRIDALHETLAEMAKLDWQGALYADPWYVRNAKVWRPLYDAVLATYTKAA